MFFNIRSGIGKIPVSGSGSGQVGVLKSTFRYLRVSFLLSGISGYSWVFLRNYDIISFLGGSEPNIEVIF